MKKSIVLFMSLLMLVGCSSNSAKTTQKESTKESTVTKKVTKTKQKKKEVTKQSTSTSSLKQNEEQQIGLSDFVGGWGVPQSGNLFFINSDGTYSSANADNAPLGELTFTVLENDTIMMSSALGNMIKELDGSLTSNGQNYQYLGNVTKEEFLKNKETSDSPNSQEDISASTPPLSEDDGDGSSPVDNSGKVAEIASYFDQQKSITLDKKRKQIQAWKDAGEVSWSDDLISSSMQEFETYLGSSSNYTDRIKFGNVSQESLKSSIDEDLQFAFDTMIQK